MTLFRKYLLISLLFALLNAILILVFFVPRFDHTDTHQYISTMKYISGDSTGKIFPYRILKPLPILIGVVLSPVIKAENTLIAQNIIFYLLSVWLIFLLVHRIYRNEKQACYGAILYAGAYPMLAYGLASLTDMPGWFFYLFSILISLDFLKKPRLKTALLAGFIAGIGMLFKENVAAAPIFFASLLFIASQLPFKEKIKYILIFGVAFIFFPIINNIIVYKLYSFSYLAEYKHVWGLSTGGYDNFYMITPLRILIEISRVFLMGWLFVLLGILKEFAIKNSERIKILLALILPSLSFFAWPYPHNRMIFIAAPLLIFLGSFGVLRNFRNLKINYLVEIFSLFLYVLINYVVLDLLLKYGTTIQPPGTLFG